MKNLLFTVLLMLTAVASQAQTTSGIENQVTKTIMDRRSIRHYTDQPVSRDTLIKLVECGINAPNAQNKQEWAIRIVDSKEYLDGVTELMKKEMPFFVKNDDPKFRNGFRNATAVIFVAIPENDPHGMNGINAGALCENICLTAQSMGLGSIIMGGPSSFIVSNPEAKPYLDRLDIPEGYKLSICVGVGYADETPDAKPRDMSKVKFAE